METGLQLEQLAERWSFGGLVDPTEIWVTKILVDRLLARLSERDRQIALAVADGCSFAEIGAMLGISRQAAQQAWVRLRTHCRAHLDEEMRRGDGGLQGS